MNAEEYRETLARLGLTQAGAARLLDINPRTSRKWALGEQEVGKTAARFLRFLAHAGVSGDEVMKALRD